MKNREYIAGWAFLLSGIILSIGFIFLARNFYMTFFGANSHVEIMVNSRTLRKDKGLVRKKQSENGRQDLEFSYTDGKQTYYGLLSVGEREFNETKVGDAVTILYDVDQPSRWMLPKKDWGFWFFGVLHFFSTLLVLYFAVMLNYLGYEMIRTGVIPSWLKTYET